MSRRAGGASGAPVFLIGAPRSGTSLLYKSLALHDGFGYISNYNERLPRWSAVAVVNRLPAALPRARRAVWFGGENGNAYVYNAGRPLAHTATIESPAVSEISPPCSSTTRKIAS